MSVPSPDNEKRRPLSFGELDRRLDEARSRQGGDGPDGALAERPQSSLGWAFRIGVELVAALIVGVGIGWLLDRWLGTMPLFLVLFFFLGAAAGGLNVWRAVGRMGLAPGYRRPGEPGDGGGPGADR
ncbi:MAG: AtpZ/AtpI family protein [Alphaproteobacteria bacterium]